MTKKPLFLYILLICNSIYCQINDNQIRQIKDFTNAYIIYKTIDNDTIDKDCKKVKSDKSFPINTIENPVSLDSLSNFLISNNLKQIKAKILDKIEKIEIDRNIDRTEVSKGYLDKIDNELGEPLKSKINFKNNKPIIISRIDEFLKIDTTSEADPTAKSDQNDRIKDKTHLELPSIFHWFLTLSLFGVFFYLYKRLSKINERVDRRKEELSNFKFNDLQIDTSQYDSKIKNLASDISQLKLTINELEKFIKMGSQSNINTSSKIDSKLPVQKKEYFFNMPSDNYFDNTYISDNPTNTIYKFTLLNQFNAEFEIHTLSYSISDIIVNRQSSIIPACEEQNSPPINVSKIITLPNGKGQAKLEGNKWKITKKALIKYE